MSIREVLVINDLHNAQIVRRTRATGNQRVTLEIHSEALAITVDPTLLGQAVAIEIARAMSRAIRKVGALASGSTIKRRLSAARNPSARHVQRRYSGGRTPAKSPGARGPYMFNDSGRLADGIQARATSDGTFTMNVTANRLKEVVSGVDEFRPGAYQLMLTKLMALVPALRNAALLLEDRVVKRAIEETLPNAIVKGMMDQNAGSLAADALKKTASNLMQLGSALGKMPTPEEQRAARGEDEG